MNHPHEQYDIESLKVPSVLALAAVVSDDFLVLKLQRRAYWSH